jgi:hypothetical protein
MEMAECCEVISCSTYKISYISQICSPQKGLAIPYHVRVFFPALRLTVHILNLFWLIINMKGMLERDGECSFLVSEFVMSERLINCI